MKQRAVVVVCCVCGREKTEQGWEYRDGEPDPGSVLSHGFCDHCYEIEMMKMRWESRMAQPAEAT